MHCLVRCEDANCSHTQTLYKDFKKKLPQGESESSTMLQVMRQATIADRTQYPQCKEIQKWSPFVMQFGGPGTSTPLTTLLFEVTVADDTFIAGSDFSSMNLFIVLKPEALFSDSTGDICKKYLGMLWLDQSALFLHCEQEGLLVYIFDRQLDLV